jgi:ribosomal protein S18 acetylase RimI-like enzyme
MVRDFRFTDLEGVLAVYAGVPAADHARAGLDPQAAVRQVRAFTRGRMIPARVLMALLGYRWGIVVAEEVQRIVGVGGYFGPPQRVALGPLLVLPEHRGCGLGGALLGARLERLRRTGGRLAVAEVESSNAPALHLLQRAGFTVYDAYTEYELALPLPPVAAESPFTLRAAAPADRAALLALEQQVRSAPSLETDGSLVPRLYPSAVTRVLERFFRRFNGRQSLEEVVVGEGQVVGLLRALSEVTFRKGWVTQAWAARGAEARLTLALLSRAAAWLHALNKDALRVRLSGAPTRLPPEVHQAVQSEEQRLCLRLTLQ